MLYLISSDIYTVLKRQHSKLQCYCLFNRWQNSSEFNKMQFHNKTFFSLHVIWNLLCVRIPYHLLAGCNWLFIIRLWQHFHISCLHSVPPCYVLELSWSLQVCFNQHSSSSWILFALHFGLLFILKNNKIKHMRLACCLRHLCVTACPPASNFELSGRNKYVVEFAQHRFRLQLHGIIWREMRNSCSKEQESILNLKYNEDVRREGPLF